MNGAPAVAFEDAEDSPLYERAAKRAYADMAAHDQLLGPQDGSGGTVLGTGAVIVVEGTRWHRTTDTGQAGQSRPRPLGVTTELSCQPTCAVSCAPTTCGATICVGYTCRGTTCYTPSCVGATCTEPTCIGVSCSIPGDTCYFPTSCGQATCTATCTWTCTPANCPTVLSDVQVPRPGEIQMSFMSSGSVRYTLQWSTNLSAGQWANVYAWWATAAL